MPSPKIVFVVCQDYFPIEVHETCFTATGRVNALVIVEAKRRRREPGSEQISYQMKRCPMIEERRG